MLTKQQQIELDSDIGSLVNDRVDKRLREHITRRFTPGGDGGFNSTDKASGNQGFSSFSDFVKTIAKNRYDSRLKALGEGTDSLGGFLVPESFRAALFAQTLEREIVRPRAVIIPCPTDTILWPAIDDTDHSSNLYGGVVAYWGEEAGTKTATDPKFRQIKYILKKLYGFTRVSDELIQDSGIALEVALVKMFSSAIAWYEDLAFLRGSGVGQPLGVFGSGALLTVNRAVANQVSLADLADMMARLYPDSLNASTTVWVMSPAVLGQLIPLVTTPITWVSPTGGAAVAIPKTILGFNYYVTEKVPTLGVTGDIGLYDLSYYGIADKGEIRFDTSAHLYFQTDETAFRFVQRVDGHSLVDTPFTPYNGGATLSPFVQLHSSSA